MKPKDYSGKGEGKRPFPFFDIRELVKSDDMCHVLVVSTGTLRMIRQLSPFVKWATRWDNQNSESDIDEFIRRYFMELIPCDNILTELKDAIITLSMKIEGMEGTGDSMCHCGCGCGCSNQGGDVYNPIEYPNVPDVPSTVTPNSDRDCKFAHYTADKVLNLLDSLSTRIAYAVAGMTFIAFASLFVGQVEITGALLATMWTLFSQGMLTAAGIAGIYTYFNQRKDDFICYVSVNSNNSPASFKQACISWTQEQGDTNQIPLTFLMLLFQLGLFYNTMLGTEWMSQYEDATCCGDGGGEPPTTGAYEYVECNTIQLGAPIGNDGQEITYATGSVSGSNVTVYAHLSSGQLFKIPVAAMVETLHQVVAFCVRCDMLNKSISSNPTFTYIRDSLSVPDNQGQVLSSEGICGWGEEEVGENADEYIAYLESIGYDVFRDVEAVDLVTVNSQNFFEFASYDKETTGGHGGDVNAVFTVGYIRKLV